MQIIKLNHLKSHAFDHFEPPLTATALGNFDGVHLGHQEVIREAVRIARSKNWQAGVMTFHPHPREVLAGKQNGGYLTPIEERYQYFEALGVDIVYIIQFNHAIAQMLPEEFIHAYIEGLHIKHVVTGFDFTFGHKGSGDTNLLAEWAREVQSFQYTKVLPVTFNGEKISTTRIKALLEAGDVATAGNLLGKPYTVTGKVVHGAKQGRLLGFPTANLEFEHPFYMPKLGVYAVLCHIDGLTYRGVLNYGKKPTFQQGLLPLMEVHLLDQQLDLYEKRMTLEFVTYLRAEQKFSSLDELKGQISKDADQARAILTARS